MASKKTFVARKDFTLDCGHIVRKGDKFVITSIFTCEKDRNVVIDWLGEQSQPSWWELFKESVFP